MADFFISDLHLDADRPASTEIFLHFLEERIDSGDRLFILGDLFEAWIGDDDDDNWLSPVRQGIAALSARNASVAFMHGNRDFLIGPTFAAATGTHLLDEYETITLQGERVLLTHGDLLCTDDLRYMTLRAQLRDPAWQANFLGKSLQERREIAKQLRNLSREEMADKSESIMDVNQATVNQVMQRFKARTLIHGHTHRQNTHVWQLDGQQATRIVLADWYSTGSYLVWDLTGPRSVSLTDTSSTSSASSSSAEDA